VLLGAYDRLAFGSASDGSPTVFDDGESDFLTGGGGRDWIRANLQNDRVTDKKPDEELDLLFASDELSVSNLSAPSLDYSSAAAR
jgi:hypothetical protein